MDGNLEMSRAELKGRVTVLPATDRTLTKEGYAADAKATGEALDARVKTADIADNLTTDNPDMVLSASQGVELKRLIDALSEKVNG